MHAFTSIMSSSILFYLILHSFPLLPPFFFFFFPCFLSTQVLRFIALEHSNPNARPASRRQRQAQHSHQRLRLHHGTYRGRHVPNNRHHHGRRHTQRERAENVGRHVAHNLLCDYWHWRYAAALPKHTHAYWCSSHRHRIEQCIRCLSWHSYSSHLGGISVEIQSWSNFLRRPRGQHYSPTPPWRSTESAFAPDLAQPRHPLPRSARDVRHRAS